MPTLLDTFFVHIGSAKTGTTAIQRTFHASRRLLARQAYLYPLNGPNHFFLVSHFLDAPERMSWVRALQLSRNELKQFVQEKMNEFEQELRLGDYRFGVVSSEHFQGLDATGCQELRAYLGTIAREVKVVCYVRYPTAHSASLTQQLIKHGRLTLSDIETRKRRVPYFRFSRTLPKWIEAFGRENLIVRPFVRNQLKNHDAVADFADVIGYTGKLREMKKESFNDSLSMPGTLIADALTGFAPAGSPLRGKQFYLPHISGPKFRLPRAMAEWVVAQCQEDLAFLEAEFGLTLANPDDGVYAEDIAPVFTEETVHSLAHILNDLTLKISRLEEENARLKITLGQV